MPRQRSPHSSSWVGRSQRAQARHRGNGAPHSLLGKEGGTGPVHPPRPEPRDRRLRPRRTQGARGDPGSPQARPGAATPTHPLPPPLHIHERAPAPPLATPTLPHPTPNRESGGPGAAWPSGPRRGGAREAPCPAPATVMFTIERALERFPPLPASAGVLAVHRRQDGGTRRCKGSCPPHGRAQDPTPRCGPRDPPGPCSAGNRAAPRPRPVPRGRSRTRPGSAADRTRPLPPPAPPGTRENPDCISIDPGPPLGAGGASAGGGAGNGRGVQPLLGQAGREGGAGPTPTHTLAGEVLFNSSCHVNGCKIQK